MMSSVNGPAKSRYVKVSTLSDTRMCHADQFEDSFRRYKCRHWYRIFIIFRECFEFNSDITQYFVSESVGTFGSPVHTQNSSLLLMDNKIFRLNVRIALNLTQL